MFHKKALGLLAFLVIFTTQSFCQSLGNAPFSSFGIGELYDVAFAAQQQMGGAGVSYANGIFINNLNPALLARNRVTALEVGVLVQVKQLRDARQSQQVVGGNLNNIAMAFPVKNYWTTAISYTPHSYLDYEVKYIQPIPNTLFFAEYQQRGTGGTQKVTWSNGFNVKKKLYIGLSTSYLFGAPVRESSTKTLLGDGTDYRLVLGERFTMHHFLLKGGATYRHKVRDKRFINIGGTIDLPTNLRVNKLRTYEYFLNEIPVVRSTDTLSLNERGRISLPGGFKVGITFENPYKFAWTTDIGVQQWTNFRDINGSNQGLKNTLEVRTGIEYTPNIAASTGFWKRVPYRFGLAYQQLPYSVNGKQVAEMRVTGGLSLPLNRSGLSDMHLGFTLGQRGETSTIQERFARVTLGFTLSDRWFYKQVVD